MSSKSQYESELLALAIEGDLAKVRALLKSGVAMPKDILQRTIFSGWAQEDVQMLELLIDAGADVNAIVDSNTPLYSAAMVGPFPSRSLATTDLLLKRGADPNLKGRTFPLHCAVTTIADETVKRLLKGGADINALDNEGQTPTHACVMAYFDFLEDTSEDSIEEATDSVMNVLEHLLAAKPDLSIKNNDEDTALSSVIAKNVYPESVVQALIDAGAPLDCNVEFYGEEVSLLAAAVLKNFSKDVIVPLMQAGCDPCVEYDIFNGATLLMTACQLSPISAQAMFEQQPALTSLTGSIGSTMLHFAAAGGDLTLLQFLLRQGVDPTVVNNKGETALEMAQGRSNQEAIELLQNL